MLYNLGKVKEYGFFLRKTDFKLNLFNLHILEPRLSPLLKWPGGKERELKYILPEIPDFERYFEPFVGGGAVYFSINSQEKYINDKSNELINLYQVVKEQDETFFREVSEFTKEWKRISDEIQNNKDELLERYKNGDAFEEIALKIKRVRKVETQKGKLSDSDILDNIESAFKANLYLELRKRYNHQTTSSLFFFIRNYAYSGMFRYNKNGEFNVPYGGIGYNKKYLEHKLEYFHSPRLLQHLKSTQIENLDFLDFFKKWKPKENDFIFLDPPYDSDFSTYAQNSFGKEEHIKLKKFLEKTPAKWLMVIGNTYFICNLYKRFNITSFDKQYQVSFKNRNEKKITHLIIKNY
jgi:DNA adenine methylase